MTFKEFLQVLVIEERGNTTNFGRHWLPYYKLCTPCKINYDYIGNIEKLEEFWNLSGLKSLVPISWKNKKMSNQREIFESLIKSVPRLILVKAYQKLKMDYEIFHYDFNNILKLANYRELTPEEDIFIYGET